MNDEIRSAIENSRRSGQIVSVDVDCTASNLWALLASIIECGWEMCKLDGNTVDVRGWTDAQPEGEQDWRLVVQCQPEQVEA